jgi:Domain of unknown function (DUF5664)
MEELTKENNMGEDILCSRCGETFKVLHSCTSSVTKEYCPQHRIYSCLCSYPKLNVDKLPESHWIVDDASVVTTPQQKKEPGTKFDAGKPPMELLSTEALVQISRVLEFGKKKYDAHNWRKGMSWSRLIGAALRHLAAFKDGEDLDPETGLSHLAHLGCCTMFLLEFIKTHPEMDDRYKVVDKSDQK